MNSVSRSLLTLGAAAFFLAACDIDDLVDPPGDPGDDPAALSGTISEDLTLTPDVPWRVVGDLTVSGATLAIEPGTTVTFEQQTGLTIRSGGRLSAIGTEDAPITLTGEATTPGSWDGVFFQDVTHPDNVLHRVTIEHGGGSAHHSSTEPANLTVGRSLYDASVTVTSTTLRHSGGFGLFLHANGSLPGSSDNTYIGNASGPAAAYSSTVHHLDGGSSYGEAPVRVTGNSVGSDVTWQALGVPYRMSGETRVSDRLTIDPGAVFQFDGEGALRFEGGSVVRALGTADDPIVFTGTQEQPGWWHGIWVTNTTHPENLMEHVVVEHAGRDAFHSSTRPANITVGRNLYDAALTLRHAVVRDGAGVGLFMHSNGVLPDSEANTYTENTDGPVELAASGAHYLDGASSFVGNGDNDYAWVNGNTFSHDATWQALDVPYGVRGTAEVRNAELAIDPGAVIAFDAEAGLVFGNGSTARVIGTADAPILFTGTQQQPGWWQGVWITQTTHPDNRVRHATFEYGGNSAFHSSTEPANLTVGRNLYDAGATVTDTTLRNGAGWGLFVHSNGAVNAGVCTDNVFGGNEGGDCEVR